MVILNAYAQLLTMRSVSDRRPVPCYADDRVQEMHVNRSLSTNQLRTLAREGARVRLQQLRAEIAALESLIGERVGAAGRRGRPAGEGRRGHRQLSAAGRAAIAAGQKARWQKIKAAKTGSQTSGDMSMAAAAPRSRRKRSTMSAAARKAVSERMRKYWAARRKRGADRPARAGSARR